MLDDCCILLEFQRLIENYAESVINDLTNPINEDINAYAVNDLEVKISDLIGFYSDRNNWHYFNAKYELSKCIIAPTNATTSSLFVDAFKDCCDELFKLCEGASEPKQCIVDCTKNLQSIQQATLKCISQMRLYGPHRSISFGKLRGWTNDMMKSRRRIGSGITPEATYAVAAKCARLRRRLGRLFCLARTAHLLNARLTALEHPQIAALQQNLMRIRLQLILRLKQNLILETPVLCHNPEQLALRLESLTSGLAAGVAHEKVHSRLDTLAENIADLFLALSQETSGLSKVLEIAEPFSRDVVSQVVRRSLDDFCNFYVTSVASELGSDKADALLAQLIHPEEETEDLSPSDTEAMMDAFDVFDSFNDQNSSPIASDVEKPREDPQTGNEVSTLSVEPTFPRNSEDVPITEEVNFSGERYFEMPLPLANTRTLFEGPSTPKETPPLSIDEDMEVNEEQNVDIEREEGEIFDDENLHHDLDSLNECCDIDETEEAIMREWAPRKEDKSTAKPSSDESVQKAVSDAVKSCYRELLAIATLGVSDWESGVSKSAESQPLPSTIVNEIRSTMRESQSFSRRSHSIYSRAVMLGIREFIFASLLRQRQSKQLYRKFFEGG